MPSASSLNRRQTVLDRESRTGRLSTKLQGSLSGGSVATSTKTSHQTSTKVSVSTSYKYPQNILIRPE